MSVYMTEEEQLQAIKKWWLRYNTPILVLLSVVMLSVAGYRYWNWHHEKILTQASTVYERLMVSFSEHKNKEIRSYANQLIKEYGQTVYADAARMTLAKIYVTIVNELKGDIFLEKGDYQQAIKLYKQAINEAKTHGIGNLFLEMKTNELAALTQSKNVLTVKTGTA